MENKSAALLLLAIIFVCYMHSSLASQQIKKKAQRKYPNITQEVRARDGILVVNGVDWQLSPEVSSFYMDLTSVVPAFDFWDLYHSNPVGLVPLGENAAPDSNLFFQYKSVVWFGGNQSHDLGFWLASLPALKQFMLTKGYLLLATHGAENYFDEELSSRFSVIDEWSGDVTIKMAQPLIANDQNLTDMPPSINFAESLGAHMFSGERTSRANDIYLFEPIFNWIDQTGKVWRGGFRSRLSDGGQFMFISGRPYAFDEFAWRANYQFILGYWHQLFIDHQDRTITTPRNDLMWLKDASFGGRGDWWRVTERIETEFVFAGYDDWFIPAIEDLEDLYFNVMLGKLGGPMPDPAPFIRVRRQLYWSSNSGSIPLRDAVTFSFEDGTRGNWGKGSNAMYAWPVRNAYNTNTSVGAMVSIQLPAMPLRSYSIHEALPFVLIFSKVTRPGWTKVITTDSGPLPPDGMQFLPVGRAAYYNVTTTADHSGPIELEVAYDDRELMDIPEADLQLLFHDNGKWENITTDLDIELNRIKGQASDLSLLGIAAPSGLPVFAKVTAGDILRDLKASAGVSWGDFNNDNYSDLFVTNTGRDAETNDLYRNNKDGSFSKVTVGEIVTERAHSAGATWGDYNNDGYLDLFVANSDGPNSLFKNNGDETFTKIAEGEIAKNSGFSTGAAWADYDNNGFTDAFLTTTYQEPNQLYLNRGDVFEQIRTGSIVSDSSHSIASAWADYDNDGDVDLFVTNDGLNGFAGLKEGQNFLYSVGEVTNNWLNIRCVGTISNVSAIGTKVRVKANIGGAPRWQLRQVSSQSGRGSQNSLNAIFGLGQASIVDSLKIQWPSGANTILTNIPANQFLEITELGEVVSIYSDRDDDGSPKDFQLLQNYPNPFNERTIVGYIVEAASPVTLKVYTVLGREVKVLTHEEKPAGVHQAVWDGTDKMGQRLPSGIYFCQLQRGRKFSAVRKMLLIR